MKPGIFFDLDDTLVDTSDSFDAVVCSLVEQQSGAPLQREELQALRSQGGFNDDWDATVELLRQRDVRVTREQMAGAGLTLYLQIAQESERLFVELTLLEGLKQSHRLFIVTGRVRAEYDPVWAKSLNPLFEEIVCRDDRPHLKPKPSPDQIMDLMERHGVAQGFFVGNSVDDMRAGADAGLTAIGVATNQSEETLKRAGARHVVSHPRELPVALLSLR